MPGDRAERVRHLLNARGPVLTITAPRCAELGWAQRPLPHTGTSPNAHCAAWIYTKEDCMMRDENDEPVYPIDEHPELSERIFNDVGNVDYIYQVIQESVDEATEEQFMVLQQELV